MTQKLGDLSTEGMRKYASVVVDLVIFTLGAINNSLSKWKKTTYNDEVKEAGMVFAGAIGTGMMDDLKDALQSLILALFNQEHVGRADKYSTIVFSLLVLYLFCREGNLDHCGVFACYFSPVIWFRWVSVYNAIKEEAEGSALGFFE